MEGNHYFCFFVFSFFPLLLQIFVCRNVMKFLQHVPQSPSSAELEGRGSIVVHLIQDSVYQNLFSTNQEPDLLKFIALHGDSSIPDQLDTCSSLNTAQLYCQQLDTDSSSYGYTMDLTRGQHEQKITLPQLPTACHSKSSITCKIAHPTFYYYIPCSQSFEKDHLQSSKIGRLHKQVAFFFIFQFFLLSRKLCFDFSTKITEFKNLKHSSIVTYNLTQSQINYINLHCTSYYPLKMKRFGFVPKGIWYVPGLGLKSLIGPSSWHITEFRLTKPKLWANRRTPQSTTTSYWTQSVIYFSFCLFFYMFFFILKDIEANKEKVCTLAKELKTINQNETFLVSGVERKTDSEGN
ncbi:putative signal peptide protein [Puccinia sorghi]|uniref:Putative signal peptide protein n=1 Tax=Puccinia sorghi TaxID=27349 RepID=A0A0L6UMG1_9BASI|nr:putative signal peptide protein [Puccinia sorghi]